MDDDTAADDAALTPSHEELAFRKAMDEMTAALDALRCPHCGK